LAQKGESYLNNPQPASSEPWPGLVGMNININTGLFEDAFGGWVGGADSYYEYLIKMYVYDTTRFASYRDRWIKAADSSIAHLVSHPSSRPDLTFLSVYNGKKLIYESQHRKYPPTYCQYVPVAELPQSPVSTVEISSLEVSSSSNRNTSTLVSHS
jgi:mannosyl-oligosaccharide alpha-1,2-mannosidase